MKSDSGSAPIRVVGVVGAGTMGSGIAQLCAQRGFSVRIFDAAESALAASREKIEAGLSAAVGKGKLTGAQAREARDRVQPASRLEDLAGVDLVIEAASEDIRVKRDLFSRIGTLLGREVILATNTSSLPVREIAAAAAYPERVLGMHFFNPPVAMKLVELVRAPGTKEAHFKRAREFALALGRTPVAAQDTPGFIVNRVVRPFYLQALRLAGEGKGGYAFIDRAAKEHGHVPMGPFELMDLIGLDVNLAITKAIFEALGRSDRLRPHSIQERLVESGHNGRKTGQGFYLYEGGKLAGENPEALRLLPADRTALSPSEAWDALSGAIFNEAERAAREGVASRQDIDTAVKLAMNFPQGPFEWRKERASQA